ncbi:MAG: polymer-forming cytoskeletal protein [Myxococcota bacterium]
MGFNEFRKGREGAPAPAPTSGGVGALTAFIDQGSEFSGKLSFRDTVRIDGRFQGEIASDNTLIVGETGLVEADIDSEIVIVSGEVRGDIRARRQVTLHKTARVSGNLETTSLVVEEGAELNGGVSMQTGAKSAQRGEKVVKLRDSGAGG